MLPYGCLNQGGEGSRPLLDNVQNEAAFFGMASLSTTVEYSSEYSEQNSTVSWAVQFAFNEYCVES